MVFSIASANACILHVSIQSWRRLWTVASAFSGDASDSAERRPPRWNLNAAWSSKLMSDDLGLSWFIRFKIDRTVSKNIGKPQLINQPLELQFYTRHVLSLLCQEAFACFCYVLISKEYDVRSLRIEIAYEFRIYPVVFLTSPCWGEAGKAKAKSGEAEKPTKTDSAKKKDWTSEPGVSGKGWACW